MLIDPINLSVLNIVIACVFVFFTSVATYCAGLYHVSVAQNESFWTKKTLSLVSAYAFMSFSFIATAVAIMAFPAYLMYLGPTLSVLCGVSIMNHYITRGVHEA